MIHRYAKIIPPFAKQLLQRVISPAAYPVSGSIFGRNRSDDTTKFEGCDGKDEEPPIRFKSNFNFHPETEAIFNQQVNVELKAFYYYLSMASYFGRVDVALSGCESFFTQMHEEEREHASRLLNYIKMRGGVVNLRSIESPNDQDWRCPLHAFKIEVTEQLVNVNSVATKHDDLNASDFIVTNFMEDQMRGINEIARIVTVLSGVGDKSLARFLFDKDLLENHVSPEFYALKGNASVHLKKK